MQKKNDNKTFLYCLFLDRTDSNRFFGDGVSFKAKLIGILEVNEARGDRMCQDALQDLKMAIRAAGEHKQRITIFVTIDGLRLKDEKTGVRKFYKIIGSINYHYNILGFFVSPSCSQNFVYCTRYDG